MDLMRAWQDLPTLFKDVANEYCELVMVTAVIIPADVQELEYAAPGHAFKMVPSSLDMSWSAPVPPDAELRRAADVLNSGEKVAMLVGQSARGAAAEVTQVADVLGVGVAKAPLGLG